MPDTGVERRLSRLFERAPTILLPLDDGMISGPIGGLARVRSLLQPELLTQVDAVLGFRGLLRACHAELRNKPFVMNLSGSTTLYGHTQKTRVAGVASAMRLGAEAVAFHVNLSDPTEGRMLELLGRVVDEADVVGLPVMAIAYPRRAAAEGDDNYDDMRERSPELFADLVAHAVRVAVEIGASVVKTVYTGDPESFARVVVASCGVPVFVAGGPPSDDETAISKATDAIRAGAAGVAYGRQVFMHEHPVDFVSRLRRAVDHSDS